jgi:prepilin-type N-terminal cleavage/methylation domain-containing protein
VIAALRRRMSTDAGFTLSELMISMTIMGIVTVISATGFLQMFRTTDLAETAALTQTATLASFSKLDRDVRYAARINVPYQQANGDWSVDYVIPAADGTPQCVRLTLPSAGGSLTRLQWPQSAASPAGYTATQVATDMVPDNGTASPFLRTAGSATGDITNFDQLEIKLKSSIGVLSAGSVRKFDLYFTALNTANDTSSPLACSQA